MNKPTIMEEPWGTVDSKPVSLYTLSNSNGHEIKITNYGGTITSWIAPDKQGKPGNIVLGFDHISDYLKGTPYFGSIIGRYGNRIANGKFQLNNKSFHLITNNGPNHLHGGTKGFDKVVWDAAIDTSSSPCLKLYYLSKDGEEGYPGNLHVHVLYTLNEQNELIIEYYGETDQPTLVNLTNHSYFNLTGDLSNTILDHQLTIRADHYTPVDKTSIPTGEIKPVKNSPFDFNEPHSIGSRIEQVEGGYDHNFVLKHQSGLPEATLHDPSSGRTIEVYTTEPGVQFYSGNFLDGTLVGRGGKAIVKHAGVCLETQHFPDSPNKPAFPSTVLKPKEKYHTLTKYKFLIMA